MNFISKGPKSMENCCFEALGVVWVIRALLLRFVNPLFLLMGRVSLEKVTRNWEGDTYIVDSIKTKRPES